MFLCLVSHTRLPRRCLRLSSYWLCLHLSTRNLSLSRPRNILSAGASSPVCLLLAGWLLFRQLLRASALHHLLLRCRLTHPSSTPLLCSRQLVVASHLFAPPLPLDAPPPDNWLCHCRHRYAGVVAVDVQTSLPLSRLRLLPSSLVVKRRRRRPRCRCRRCRQSPSPLSSSLYPLALSQSSSTLSPVALLPTSPTLLPVTPSQSLSSPSPVMPSPLSSISLFVAPSQSWLLWVVRGAQVCDDADVVAFNQPVQKGQI